MKHGLICVILAGLAGLGSASGAVLVDFSAPVTTGSAQAPGVWYTDRYAPAGFTAPVDFLGDARLLQQISAADCQGCRPGSFTGSFYNTQGRKYDLASDTTTASIELYIPAEWAGTGRRMAGFWGTAYDAGDAVSAYPILEFASDGPGARFQGWTSSGWVSMGLPTGFAYDRFHTLSFELAGNLITYRVGDLSLQAGANDSIRIGNVILQGYNNAAGVTYDIYWDNLNFNTQIPEPSTVALLSLGLAGLAWMRRRSGV